MAATWTSRPSASTATSNTKRTHEAVADETVTKLIGDFFASDTRHLEPVDGAAAALEDLSNHAQIVILSNLPETSRDARIENLVEHGMPYPVIAGKGPKGPVVKDLLGDFAQTVVFIDDLPPNLSSVATETPHVHRLHFIADPRLAQAAATGRRRAPPYRRLAQAAEWIATVIA